MRYAITSKITALLGSGHRYITYSGFRNYCMVPIFDFYTHRLRLDLDKVAGSLHHPRHLYITNSMFVRRNSFLLLSINLYRNLKTIRNDPLQSALTQGSYTSTGADTGAGCVHTARRGGGTDPACAGAGVDPARRGRVH